MTPEIEFLQGLVDTWETGPDHDLHLMTVIFHIQLVFRYARIVSLIGQ